MDKVIDNNGYLLVCVPEGSGDFEISMSHYLNYCGYKGEGESIALPKGNYEIVGLAKDLTEEQWKEIVEQEELFINGKSQGVRYKDYWRTYEPIDEWFSVATPSGHSLLKHNKLELENTLVLKHKN